MAAWVHGYLPLVRSILRASRLFVVYGGSTLICDYLGFRIMLRDIIGMSDAARLGVTGTSGPVRDVTIRDSPACVWSRGGVDGTRAHDGDMTHQFVLFFLGLFMIMEVRVCVGYEGV